MGRTEFGIILYTLRMNTAGDFSALACHAKDDPDFHWRFASGNQNDRYRYITLKTGRGIEGMVLRTGSCIVFDETTPELDAKRLDSPVMLAENLYSAVAAPVIVNREIHGVLLTGSRSIRKYSQKEIEFAADTAQHRIQRLLEMRLDGSRRLP